MSYCKYHPLQAATHYCSRCDAHTCSRCHDSSTNNTGVVDTHCLLCGQRLKNLGITVDTLPFWRRIDKAVAYPLTAPVLSLIVALALLSASSTFMPFAMTVASSIIASGAIFAYSLACLSQTARGHLSPPEISDALQGSGMLLIRLYGAMIFLVSLLMFLYLQIGPSVAATAAVFVVIALPAMIIVYAMSERLIEALNPLRQIGLITAIGLPYGLILAILIMMLTTVDVLSSLFGNADSFFVIAAQSAIGNYYAIVMFHLMGYMIFQYQYKLGFVADQPANANTHQFNSEPEKLLARIQIQIKEGYWRSAEEEFIQALQRFPEDEKLNRNFFQFNLAVLDNTDLKQAPNGDSVQLQAAQAAFDQYFSYLLRAKKNELLYPSFSQAILCLPRYIPKSARARHQLAQACLDNGNPKGCISLLNGMHKSDPHYRHLVTAYELMLEALKQLPNREKHQDMCRRLIQKLTHSSDKVEFDSQTDHQDNTPSEEPNAQDKPSPATPDSKNKDPKDKAPKDSDLPDIEFKL